MKYSVSYGRKVQTRQYENLTVGYTLEIEDNVMSADVAYKRAVDFVESKIRERLYELEREKR